MNSADKTPKRPPLPDHIDYKNVAILKYYLSSFGHIIPRKYTKVSLREQKKLSQAVKNARIMGLIPFVGKR